MRVRFTEAEQLAAGGAQVNGSCPWDLSHMSILVYSDVSFEYERPSNRLIASESGMDDEDANKNRSMSARECQRSDPLAVNICERISSTFRAISSSVTTLGGGGF